MPSTVSLSVAKWVLDLATKLVKSDIRLHRADVIEDDMAIIFVVNHFTRLETLLLPYILYKHTGREVMGLAAAELFKGRIGQFLRSTGTVSTQAPDRDKIIVRSLLDGTHPWMIFPEGAMIKDKKVLDHQGEFRVFNDGKRRPPHKGAAVLALRAEFYRHKIACLHDHPNQEGLAAAMAMFDLASAEEILRKRTVIIPVNITYYPIRAHENLLLRMARRMAENLSPRSLEELSVEGTVLSEDTDIDIVLGDPIDVKEYLNEPEYAAVMACGWHDMRDLEADPASLFNDAARRLMLRYMRDIYALTTVNYDHLFAGLIRYQFARRFTERLFRSRVFQCAHQLKNLPQVRRHTLLDTTYYDMLFEEDSRKFKDFIGLCLKEGALEKDGDTYVKKEGAKHRAGDFHTVRMAELTQVIANEIEPLPEVIRIIKRAARTPQFLLLKQIRDTLLREDVRRFEEDYARFYTPGLSKGPEVGRPFLLRPWRIRAGIVLAHGYMAAPLEIRAWAQFLYQRGYAVYGVRLRGHGTAPEDLADSTWAQWYESLNHGFAILRTLTDHVFIGGFSTGGCLALIAAARKGPRLRGVISISAPLKLQNYSVHLAPSIITLNSLLKRIGAAVAHWEYVDNHPENPHINYTKNPLTGVRELVRVINATEELLPQVRIPTLVLQGAGDPTVHPSSGQDIFDKLGTTDKELTLFNRERHGIINGRGSEEVFERVEQFILRYCKTEQLRQAMPQVAAG